MSILVIAALWGAPVASQAEEPCPHPAVAPVLELTDILYDPTKEPPKVGEPMGDGVCELYCGIEVVDPERSIPACSSYSCTFTLNSPIGNVLVRTIHFGPRFDGFDNPTSTGTICTPWFESFAPGWYNARLECGDSASAADFDVLVTRSHDRGFDIPATLWHGTNRCPARPHFGEPPSPSLLRTPPG